MVEESRREKLISKLKKCLALSASPEPHEAAAALRQAQKLMRELDLTEADLLGLELADALVKTREGFGSCRTMNFLTSIVMEAFGVQCIYERNPGSANRLNVRYVGPRDRVLPQGRLAGDAGLVGHLPVAAPAPEGRWRQAAGLPPRLASRRP